jgi:hypothetical protein
LWHFGRYAFYVVRVKWNIDLTTRKSIDKDSVVA